MQYRSSEYKPTAHNGEPEDAILESIGDQSSPDRPELHDYFDDVDGVGGGKNADLPK